MHLEQAATLWLSHLNQRTRSAYPKQVEYLLRSHLFPALGSRPLIEVSKRDLIAVIDTAALRGPSNARHLYAYTRTFFNWCAARDLIDASPAVHISPTHLLGPQGFRARILDDRELSRVWRASLTFGPFGTMVRLLILKAAKTLLNDEKAVAWNAKRVEGGIIPSGLTGDCAGDAARHPPDWGRG